MSQDINDPALDSYLNNPYEFIILMLHDMRSPVYAIHGAAGLLAEMLDDPEFDLDEKKKINQMAIQQCELLINAFAQVSEYEKIRRDRNLAKSPDK